MDTRQRVLTAALEAYVQHGFRGATTRRIAAIAGVNEVTLFRLFGSKQALLAEALHSAAGQTVLATLPADPESPATELTDWTNACLESLRLRGPVLRACMAEQRERHELAQAAVAIQTSLCTELSGYFERMRALGLVRSSVDLTAAAAMLGATILADATGRETAPASFPGEEQAAVSYVAVILTALGFATRREVEPATVRAPPPPTMPDATGA